MSEGQGNLEATLSRSQPIFRLPYLPKQYMRDCDNPFERYSERQFKSRYRYSKDTVQNIKLPLINNELILANKRGLPVEPMVQLLLNLRYYATGNFQVSV